MEIGGQLSLYAAIRLSKNTYIFKVSVFLGLKKKLSLMDLLQSMFRLHYHTVEKKTLCE